MVKLVNISLRASTLIAKFTLIFVLAYYLDPVDVALYGLVVATISYSLYALGFDFYSYSTRELLGSSPDQWARLLRDQGVFFGLIYALILPLLFLIFFFGLLPWAVAPWFFFLIVLEHLGQELNRLLVAMSRQLLAGVVLFIRSGLWAIVVAFLFWHSEDFRELDLLFFAWSAGVSLACLLGGLALWSLERECLKIKIDWQWIVKGIKVALPLLLATLAVRAVFTIDRYWVESISGSEVLAAYVLFAGVASAVIAFLDAGVFVFLYPKIVSAYKEGDASAFKSGMLSLLKQTVIITLLLCMAASILIHPVLDWLQKEVYTQHVGVLYVMLVAMFVYSLSMVPHYGIYAMSSDKYIVVAHILTLCVFLVVAAVLASTWPTYAVPVALAVAFAFMTVCKASAYVFLRVRLAQRLSDSF